MDKRKAFLVITAVGLVPIALSYGAMPGRSLPWLFGIAVDGTNVTHIFRAVMGLYLALVLFWIAGALNDRLTVPALWSLVVFMFGLAGGRLLSLVLDGWPHWLLSAYLMAELAFGAIGWKLLQDAGDRRHAGSH
jgi:hypothetical protein